MAQLENTLASLFAKAPPLPENVKQTFVNLAPWITLVLVLFEIPTLAGLLGLNSLVYSLGAPGVSSGVSLSLLILAVAVILRVISLPGLFHKTRPGWTFSFYGVLVDSLSHLVGLNIVTMIISGAIGLYFLFQIRSYYK